jgi:hypothetical protein
MNEDKTKIIAGLHCSDILKNLSSYMDKELDPHTVDKIQQHLDECNWCTQFGGQFIATLSAMKITLNQKFRVDQELIQRMKLQILEKTKAN